jgi:hypothetical protein
MKRCSTDKTFNFLEMLDISMYVFYSLHPCSVSSTLHSFFSLIISIYVHILQCVILQETEYSETKLYAKIGCVDRETFTSTKLQLHVYTDAQCSVQYQDGETSKRHSTKGYEINGYYFSTRVSFRPPFYSCQDCNPKDISNTFNKKSGNWYDDDYISEHGKKDSDGEGDEPADDYYKDDFYGDDAYMYANDDVGRDDDARYYTANDDGGGNNRLLQQKMPKLHAARGILEVSQSMYSQLHLYLL